MRNRTLERSGIKRRGIGLGQNGSSGAMPCGVGSEAEFAPAALIARADAPTRNSDRRPGSVSKCSMARSTAPRPPRAGQKERGAILRVGHGPVLPDAPCRTRCRHHRSEYRLRPGAARERRIGNSNGVRPTNRHNPHQRWLFGVLVLIQANSAVIEKISISQTPSRYRQSHCAQRAVARIDTFGGTSSPYRPTGT